jgi:oligopeptide/dipeptide ABC transporter ATP-binding protein
VSVTGAIPTDASADQAQYVERKGALRRLLSPMLATRGLPRWLLIAGLTITLIFIVFAVFAPLIAPYGFDQYVAHGMRFPQQAPPSGQHWMGTTVLSEDVWSRIVWGARTSLEVVAISLVFAVVIGVPMGLVSGYLGGWLDRALVLINDSLIAFPYLLLAIVVAFLLQNSIGGGVMPAAVAITVVYIPQYFRVVRNSVLSVREEPYVDAARALGAKPRTVIARYVFSNVVQSVPVLGSLNAADAILTLAALSFLGIGTDPSAAAEWGYDISRGISDAQAGFWWTGLFPGLAIILLVTGLTLVGESLNDTLNPVLRRPSFARVTLPGSPTTSSRASGGRRHGEIPTEHAPGRPFDSGRAVAVKDLRVWYGTDRGPVRAVDGVTFDIRAGETLGLVGESGCGKSTLGRGLLGLLPEGAVRGGAVEVDGRNLIGLDAAEMRRIRGPLLGLVFQEPMTRLDPLRRISDHFAEALRSHDSDLSDDEVRRRALRALGQVGIPPTRYDNYPFEFSGGMRQRIMIALTLVLEPRLVVADEPTTALDVLVEAQILRILADLKQDKALALLLITHNLGIVAEACDRVAVMYAGRIVEQGPVAQVFSEPQHPYTRELLASTISLTTEELHFLHGSPPDLVEPPQGCRFHPRCPHAMKVCLQDPVPVGVRVGASVVDVECWLRGPAGAIPADGREPLPRRNLETADEA